MTSRETAPQDERPSSLNPGGGTPGVGTPEVGTPGARSLAAALALWGLDGAQCSLAAQRENQVFKVEAEQGAFALRFHRPGYRNDRELASELAWTRALAVAGIGVPGVVPSASGQLLEHLGGWQVDLLHWLDGVPMGQSNRMLERPDKPLIYSRLGEVMARLHSVSDTWQPPGNFERWAWDRAGLVGAAPLWDRFWDNPALDSSDKSLFTQFREVASRTLAAQAGGLDYGLIHADLVRENVMIWGQGESLAVALIDFDDGGYGYRLFDLATALLKIVSEPDFQDSKQALISGYLSVRDLDLTALPLFMALRATTYVGWIRARLDEPGARERQTRFIAAARRQVQAYLAEC